MASSHEIAAWIIASFDGTKSLTVEHAVEKVLLEHGWGHMAASTEASEKVRSVRAVLQSIPAESLPFDFSPTDDRRLVGKMRARKEDSPETRALRTRVSLVSSMLDALYACGWRLFEGVCAGIMAFSGASEAATTQSGGDGGIDVYGRIPLRQADPVVRNGILTSVLLDRPFLFLGQCKCLAPSERVGRPDLDGFRGAVDACLGQYEGNARPPSHRVPSEYYRRGETCIRLFFTTAEYAGPARTAAISDDIIAISGQQIAEFLVYHGIGIERNESGTEYVDEDMLQTWAGTFVADDYQRIPEPSP